MCPSNGTLKISSPLTYRVLMVDYQVKKSAPIALSDGKVLYKFPNRLWTD